jgi:hypothetical protein
VLTDEDQAIVVQTGLSHNYESLFPFSWFSHLQMISSVIVSTVYFLFSFSSLCYHHHLIYHLPRVSQQCTEQNTFPYYIARTRSSYAANPPSSRYETHAEHRVLARVCLSLWVRRLHVLCVVRQGTCTMRVG